MHDKFHWFRRWVALVAIMMGGMLATHAQELRSAASEPGRNLPDAPAPAIAVAAAQQPAPVESPQPGGTQSSSSGQSSSTQTDAQQNQREKAEQQMKEQEHQRVLGLVPNFNTSYRSDAVSLTAGEKMRLAFRSAIDPATFAIATVVAGYHEGLDDDTGFGWGAEGLGKRAGAAYLDAADGTIIGNGILPAILHQDPRYFRLGYGTTTHRLLYAMATTIICKHDNTGKWEPNYSNVTGNIISGAISNLYYPSENSGWGETITNGLTVSAEGTAGAVFQEFWPDLSRRLFHRDPTHGLDAQARAEYAASKQAHKEDKKKQPLQPAPK